jgi:hypothetical protein
MFLGVGDLASPARPDRFSPSQFRGEKGHACQTRRGAHPVVLKVQRSFNAWMSATVRALEGARKTCSHHTDRESNRPSFLDDRSDGAYREMARPASGLPAPWKTDMI